MTGCSIFSTVQWFWPDYGLLLELHTLTLAARSYVLLNWIVTYTSEYIPYSYLSKSVWWCYFTSTLCSFLMIHTESSWKHGRYCLTETSACYQVLYTHFCAYGSSLVTLKYHSFCGIFELLGRKVPFILWYFRVARPQSTIHSVVFTSC